MHQKEKRGSHPVQTHIQTLLHPYTSDLTCKHGSVGQSEGLLIPWSSVRFRLNPKNSNSHGFELHGPSIKVVESNKSNYHHQPRRTTATWSDTALDAKTCCHTRKGGNLLLPSTGSSPGGAIKRLIQANKWTKAIDC